MMATENETHIIDDEENEMEGKSFCQVKFFNFIFRNILTNFIFFLTVAMII